MKTFIFLLSMLPTMINAPSSIHAFIKYFNVPVNVYQSPIGENVEFKVFQDSINETNYYDIVILQNSPLRFKVRMQAYDTAPFLEGWVDKDCIGVYPRYLMNEEGDEYFAVYEHPTLTSACNRIYGETDSILTVIDYCGSWLKVVFMADNILHVGWTNHYCPNVYNSCT